LNKLLITIPVVIVVIVGIIILMLSVDVIPTGSTHFIILSTEYVNLAPGSGNDNRDTLAYQMVSHLIENNETHEITDVTAIRYGDDPKASVPGPIIKINQYDTVSLTVQNGLDDGCVSVHTHGLSYDINSDGTLKEINGVSDQCATVDKPYSYTYYAGDDTVGSWPYHDHTYCNSILQSVTISSCDDFRGVTGAEEIGLYGLFIVEGADADNIMMDYILYMDGNAEFHGTSINNTSQLQTPLGINPTLEAKEGDKVRFSIVGVGSEFHTFHLHANKWHSQGTLNVIDTKTIGPMERHSFTVTAGGFESGKGDWQYHCHVFSHLSQGMAGIFRVI